MTERGRVCHTACRCVFVSLAACTRGQANYTNPLPPSAKKKSTKSKTNQKKKR